MAIAAAKQSPTLHKLAAMLSRSTWLEQSVCPLRCLHGDFNFIRFAISICRLVD